MDYPRADRAEWYGQANYRNDGGIMVMMAPQVFLDAVRPLSLDEDSEENIAILAAHMREGGTLDPLVIFNDGKEDGRHRAHAAIALGIAAVPVILFGVQIARFPALPVVEEPDDTSPTP